MGLLEDNLAFLAANPNWKRPKQYPEWWVFIHLGRRGEFAKFIGRVIAKNKKEALKIAKYKFGELRGLKVEKLSPEDQKIANEQARMGV